MGTERRPIKTLIVEDDEEDFLLIRSFLSQISIQRYQLQWVSDYDAARTALARDQYDVCLLDYRLGQRSGLDLLKESLVSGCKAPIIFLTGQGDHRVDLEAMEAGAADYLLKADINPDLLERSIRYCIQVARANEALLLTMERLRLVHEAALAGTWEWDLSTNENSWSEELWRLYGLKPRSCEPSFEAWRATIHPDDREKTESLVLEAARNGTPLMAEWRVTQADGKEHWLRASGGPLHGSDGRPVKYLGIVQDITERKQAEEALKRSEERFSPAVKSAQEGVWNCDMETDEVWYSSRYKEMPGYSQDEIENHVSAWLNLLHPDDKEPSLQLVDAVMRGEGDHEIEFRLRHKDGHHLHILSRGYPVRREPDGKIVRIVGTHFDLIDRKRLEDELQRPHDELDLRVQERTEELSAANTPLSAEIAQRKQAEELLRESEELYRALFENGMDANLLTVPTGEILAANPAACTMFGWTEEELKRLGRNGIIDTSDPRLIPALQERARKGWFKGELTFIRRDRTRFLAEISSVIFGENGKKLTSTIIRDITEKKQAEEALLESEYRFRSLFENSPVAYQSLDSDGCYVDLNQKLCDLTGYQPEELLGKSFVDLWPANTRSLYWKTLEAFKSDGHLSSEMRLIGKGGKPIDVILEGRVQRNNVGDFIQAHCILTDITERKQAEEELAQKTEHLSEVNAALKALLRQREEDRKEYEEAILSNLKHLVLPYLESLRKSRLTDNQRTWLEILEIHLKQVTSNFTKKLTLPELKLSAAELRVAALVRDGKTTKEIAEILDASEKTISFHRDNIRAKLGLRGKKGGLRYLLLNLA